MQWNDHSKLVGEHAFLSASKHSWVNYDDEKLIDSWFNNQNIERGTRLHALACEHIELGIPMGKSKTTLNMYINDALGFRMKPEQVLYYSPNCFGTADAISYRKEKKVSKEKFVLRISDLKTGVTKASFVQLDIYAALFCLEYDVKPKEIIIIERIYQNDEVRENIPDYKDIEYIMTKIHHFDNMINGLKSEE